MERENRVERTCRIRFARAEDYGRVEEIMKQVQQLHVNWRPDIYKVGDPVWAREDFAAAVNQETVVVAELDGRVVGLLSILYRHVESDKQVTRDVLFIDNMAVDEPYRGQGIGHRLFDFVKELAREKKCDGIELQVNARNADAYEMYRKYGFTEKSINMELL